MLASSCKQLGLTLVIATIILLGGNGSPLPPPGDLEEFERALAGLAPHPSSSSHQLVGHVGPFINAPSSSRANHDLRQFSQHNWVLHGGVHHSYPLAPTYPPELHYYPTMAQHGFSFNHPVSHPYPATRLHHMQTISTAAMENPLPQGAPTRELVAPADDTHHIMRSGVTPQYGDEGPSEPQLGQPVSVLQQPDQVPAPVLGDSDPSVPPASQTKEHDVPPTQEPNELGHTIEQYTLILEPDDSINTLIAKMRGRAAGDDPQQGLGSTPLQLPVELKAMSQADPVALVNRILWYKARAKEVTFLGNNRVRRVLLTHIVHPDFTVHLNGFGYVGVWELGPTRQDGDANLYLRGYFDFSEEEFHLIDEQPYSTGRQFWLIVRRPRVGSQHSLRLTKTRLSEAEIKAADEGDVRVLLDPRLESRIISRVRAARSRFDAPNLGRHYYVYRESPDIVRLAQAWKSLANLKTTAMEPIKLSTEQKLRINSRIALSFRRPREVKLIQAPSGEILMLTWHHRLTWTPQHQANTLIVWRFGSINQEIRTMYAAGFFDLTPAGWKQMNPNNIPGLRESTFTHSNIAMP